MVFLMVRPTKQAGSHFLHAQKGVRAILGRIGFKAPPSG